MKRRTRSPPTTSASRTSTSGSTSDRRASMSAWIVVISPPEARVRWPQPPGPFTKKAGSSPASQSGLPAAKSSNLRVAALDTCRTRSGRLSCPVAIDPVVAALGIHVRRQRERLARLRGAPQHHQRAAQAEQRVVVGGRPVDDRLELHARRLVAAGAEVRTAER